MGNDGVKIAAAMAAGYLLGRTRKARLVFAVVGGVLMAGRGLAKLGLDESRLGAVLTEVLGDVQRSAGEALNARVGRLSDSLQSQTEGLSGGLGQDQAADDEEGGDDEERPRDAESDGAGEDEETPESPRRPARARSAGGGRREPQAAGRGRR